MLKALKTLAITLALLGGLLLTLALPVGIATGFLVADALATPSASVSGALLILLMLVTGSVLLGRSLDLVDYLSDRS